MSGKEVAPSFEPEELGWQLAATPIPRLHAAFGEGVRYALGSDPEHPVADVEVYPHAKLIRYSADGFQLTLQGEQVSGRYEHDEVVFEAQTETSHRTLRLSRFGDALAINTPLASHAPDANDQASPAEAPTPHPSLPEPTANDLSSSKENEHQERVTLEGRAGRDARLQQTAKGVAIAKFPLAVHDEVEGEPTTTWHTIVAFNGLAQEVAETVKRGETYRVVGYKHERLDKDKTIEEIYAAVVKPPKKPQPPAE